jgi:hypothetical protein
VSFVPLPYVKSMTLKMNTLDTVESATAFSLFIHKIESGQAIFSHALRALSCASTKAPSCHSSRIA